MFHTHGGKGWGFFVPVRANNACHVPIPRANTKQVGTFSVKIVLSTCLKLYLCTRHFITIDAKHKYQHCNKLGFEAVADYVLAYDRCNLYMICKQTKNTHF